MAATSDYRIVFPDWYDERGEWEAKEKGWLQGVEIQFANGYVQPLFFYDPVRLAQDLDAQTKSGEPYIAHAGLVVIPEITRQAIVATLQKLVETDYFSVSKRAG